MMKDDYKRENGARRAVLAYMKAVKDHETFDLTPYELSSRRTEKSGQVRNTRSVPGAKA